MRLSAQVVEAKEQMFPKKLCFRAVWMFFFFSREDQ